VRDGHVDDDDAGRDSVEVTVGSRAPRRAEVGMVRRMLMIGFGGWCKRSVQMEDDSTNF
jgi:hypothetical protein